MIRKGHKGLWVREIRGERETAAVMGDEGSSAQSWKEAMEGRQRRRSKTLENSG